MCKYDPTEKDHAHCVRELVTYGLSPDNTWKPVLAAFTASFSQSFSKGQAKGHQRTLGCECGFVVALCQSFHYAISAIVYM